MEPKDPTLEHLRELGHTDLANQLEKFPKPPGGWIKVITDIIKVVLPLVTSGGK